MPFFNSNNIDNNFFSAYTKISSASTFNGTVNCFLNGNTSTRWEYSDGHAQTTGTTSYNIPGSGSRIVKAVVNRNSNIKKYDFENMNISGSVKLFEENENLNNQNTSSYIDFRNNSDLNELTLPLNSNRFVRWINFNNCGLTGQIDFSTMHFSGFSGEHLGIIMGNNSGVNSIVLKDEIYTIPTSNIDIYGCSIGTPFSTTLPGTINLNTTVDLRNFKGLGESINITGGGFPNGNSAITYVYFPDKPSGQTIGTLMMNGLPNYTGNSYNLDLSWAGGNLGGYCVFNNLPQITGVTFFSAETNTVLEFDVAYCDIQGNLNLSQLNKLSNIILFNNNTGVTNVTFSPISGNNISQVDCSNTSLSNLDISIFSTMPDYFFNTSFCPFLTGLTLPNTILFSSGTYIMDLEHCNYTDLDFTSISVAHPFGTRLLFNNNLNLSAFTFPHEFVSNGGRNYNFMYFQNCNLKYFGIENLSGSNDNILSIQLENNSMTAAVVNENLVKLDNLGWTGNTVDIDGNNAAPDNTSGGFDGIAAKLSLIGKGWSVTSN